MMESSGDQVVPKASSEECRLSPAPWEYEPKFCMFMKEKIENDRQPASFQIWPGIIKFYVKFNYRILEPIDDLIKIVNENMGNFRNEGWDLFYVRENVLPTPVEGFEKEWECISFNLNCLDIVNISVKMKIGYLFVVFVLFVMLIYDAWSAKINTKEKAIYFLICAFFSGMLTAEIIISYLRVRAI